MNGNNYSATVPLNEGQNTITVLATDAAQNTTRVARDLARDSTPPTIVVERPVDGSATNHAQVEVVGVLDDATATSITVQNAAAVLNGNEFTAAATLAEGANTIHVRATDAAGNQTESTVNITFDTTPPALLVTAPVANTTTKNNILSVAGSSTDATPVTVTANEQTLTMAANGTFSDLVVLNEGNNEIIFTAKDAAGNPSQSIVRSVVLDTVPPQVTQLTPAQHALIGSTTTAVQGHVTDATTTIVKVNDVVVNTDATGNFTAANVAIVEGENRISISATDAAGNNSVTTLVLAGGDVTAPAAPQLFAINALTRLAFQTIEGRAEPDAQVVISGGVEPVTTTASQGTGLFVANVDLIPGANQLSVTATDTAGNVSAPTGFSITSNPNLMPPAGQPFQINSSSGNAQHSLMGTELPRPVITLITDQTGAPVSGVNVHFTVVEGGGHFVTGAISDSVSDAEGHASARYISGSSPGIQIIRATFDGNTSTPAVFSAEAFAPTTGATTVSGVVLDQDLRALPNVLVRISGQQTRTAVDGRFKVLSVPAGPHQLLELIGRDQVTLPGRWPNITYDFDVLPGVDNDLGRPLFLPRVNEGVSLPLDSQNIVTQDTTVELAVAAGMPPIQVTALAGTHVSFPPDVTDKRLSVTRIPTNRVPMVLEEGRATNLYISVQPSGALFDQPLRITFPNLDEQPANSAVLLMSFDHDAGRYVQVGTGHVTADARSVISDPGSGIRVGAWHALPPPPPRPEVTVLGHIRIKDNPVFDKRAITKAEAWVEGVSAILVSSPDADDRLDFRATYSLPPGSTPRPTRLESTVAADEFDGSLDVHGFSPDGSPVTRVNSTSSFAENGLVARAIPPTKPAALHGPASESSDSAGEPAPVSLSRQQPTQDVPVFYGGSKDALSDLIDVVFSPKDTPLDTILPKIKSITWSVTGPGGENYQLPDPLEKATTLHVRAQLPAGLQTFKCVIRYRRGGVQTLTKDIDIGVRTDDLIALGWIDTDNVPLSDVGVSTAISFNMPVNGSPTEFLDRIRCNEAVGHLSINDLGYFTSNGMAFPLSAAERIYILNWMFKYAGSHSPVSVSGSNFQGSDGLVSEAKVTSFTANHSTSYKVLNRLQIKYRVSADGERLNGDPIIEHSASSYGARTVGMTPNPCTGIAGFLTTFDTQQGFADMKTVTQTDTFEQINDGSPDAKAIRAFNTLTGKDVPPGQTAKFWENVGSQIAFPVMFGQVGKFVTQPYPTFYLYRNGELENVRKQAPNPIDHFYPNPYPFGNVSCGFFELVTPGGRCGDAVSPPAPGSRVPPYVEDLLHPPGP